MSKYLLNKKYLWTAVIIYACLIFVGSSIPGSEIDTGPPGFDKLLHLLEYLILSVLLYKAIASSYKIRDHDRDLKRILILSFLISALFGVSDEIHQLFVPNRFFELFDIFTDGVGSLLGSYWGLRSQKRKRFSWYDAKDYREARHLQEKLSEKLVLDGDLGKAKIVAGADVSSEKGGSYIFAAVVVMDIDTFEVIDSAHHSMNTTFPYIPGLLSFREGPAIVKAFEKLKKLPQVVIFDGQGVAHQRGFGLASHLGVILGIPSVGCAKTRLVGEFGEVGQKRGSRTPLTLNGDIVGYVVRTKDGVKPLFVSPGNLISHQGAVDLVLSATGKYRLPEPIRAAHNLANRFRKEFKANRS